MDTSRRPMSNECFDFHRDYVARVPNGDILETLKAQIEPIMTEIASIPEEQSGVIHQPFGWTIRQDIEHCVEAERVFGYRALRFGTGDLTELPGWDENTYAATNYGPHADLKGLSLEFAAIRQGNLFLLARLADEAWDVIGKADGRQMSVRTIAWLMAGHWLHHKAILDKRLGRSK